MNKRLEDIIVATIFLPVTAAAYLIPQVVLYIGMDAHLESKARRKGVAVAVEAAKNTKEDASNPMARVFVPGLRYAMENYIAQHDVPQQQG